MSGGGRHVTSERYRGRHRRPRSQRRLRTGVRLAVTAACAALLVCLPQPSWAGGTDTGATAGAGAARSAANEAVPNQAVAVANQATVQSLPHLVWQQPHH